MKSDLLYVTHMVECIARIERYGAGGERQFLSEQLVQDAILRNLQVLAESSQRVSAELQAGHPEIDWRGLAGFRNVLVHDYLGLNLARIWHIISVDLIGLKTQIETIRMDLSRSDEPDSSAR